MAVILDKTICHPQGGGQPSDEGFLKQGDIKFNLEALSIVKDTILHIGKFEKAGQTFKVGGDVECHIDETKRRLYARVHSAGHLLDVAMNKAGRSDLKPGKGFHQPVGSYVEYIGGIDAKERDALVKALNENCKTLINTTPEDWPVFKKVCTYEEAGKELAKAGGVPPYVPEGSSLRVCKMVEEDLGCPCGGTHVQHVKDIAEITVTKIQKKGKNTRVSYGVKAM